jgi:hypothetical protein
MPLEKASCCADVEARPVKAIIIAGFWSRSRSKFRISREESIPFITGIEISGSRLGCFDVRGRILTHQNDVVGLSRILKCLQC